MKTYPEERPYLWEVKVKSGNNYQTSQFKTKREAIKAIPSRTTSIQRFDRTYYVTPSDGK